MNRNGSTRIVMLGTGTPRPGPNHFVPATAIVVNDMPYLTQLLENERLEVVRMDSAPGDKGAMQERPDRLLYILQGAKVRFHYPGGKTEEAVWKTGDVIYQKADNRQVENIDTRNLEYMSVHLKVS
jgi:hypothetical protein